MEKKQNKGEEGGQAACQPLKDKDWSVREGLNQARNKWREERARVKMSRRIQRGRKCPVSLSSVRVLAILWQRMPLSPRRIPAVRILLTSKNITDVHKETHAVGRDTHIQERQMCLSWRDKTHNCTGVKKHTDGYSDVRIRFFLLLTLECQKIWV